jgi:hypothetical protein
MATLIAARPADLTIPKLSSGNYKVWSKLIVEALEGRGVWDYTKGTISKASLGKDVRIWRQNNVVAIELIKEVLFET